MRTFKAKDIFRTSGLSLLGVSNSHVANNLKKVGSGKSLSPLLLVHSPQNELINADVYHQIYAIYSLDEDANILCKVI